MATKKKKGKYTSPFTPVQKKAVIADYKSGKTLEQLAKSNKCSTAKVRRVLMDGKVTMRPRGPQSDSTAKVKSKKVVKAKKPALKAKVKTKKVVKAKAEKAESAPKAEPKPTPKVESRKELTPEQREAKNAKDRARRAAKKTGLNAAVADVQANATA